MSPPADRTPLLRLVALLAASAALVAGCATSSAGPLERSEIVASDPTTTTASEVTSTLAPATAPAPAVDVFTPAWDPPPERPVPRLVVDTGFSTFATTGPVELVHPAAQVERIGFHESGHDGAQQMVATDQAARPAVMGSRNRGTGDRTAADIVVPPDLEIRSPVTGTVKRAGGYILYCEHQDDFAVIEPDARPGWEVKIFHISGVQVRAGDRVEAGATLLAPRATPLPFESQVDEMTAAPAWPHVHVEIIDPSIPDRPSPGGGC